MADFRGYSSVFSRCLRALRDSIRWTQSDVAREIGISKEALGMYERGVNLPDADVVAAIAKFYNVSADFLLGLSDFRSLESVKSDETMSKAIGDIYAIVKPIMEK